MLNDSIEHAVLMDRMKLDYSTKIKLSLKRITQFFNTFDSKVYISFSGGIDSTVLLHMVRSIYPDVEAVRVIESSYRQLNEFVDGFDNVTQLRPKFSFNQVIDKYGYPVVSKEVSKNISRYRNSDNPDVKKYRKYGIKKDGTIGKVGVIPKKWHRLLDAPFKISDRCCDIIKKNPLKKYQKKSDKVPFVGVKASDSNNRLRTYLKYGCGIYEGNSIKSMPLMIFNEKEVWRYAKDNNLDYCSLYDMGEISLGCIYCMFGIHIEKTPNRIQRMYHIEKKLYHYGLSKLGMKEVLDYLRVSYIPISRLDSF